MAFLICRLDVDSKILYLGNGQSFVLEKGPRKVQKLDFHVESNANFVDAVGDIIALAHDGINTTFFGDDRFIYQLVQGKAVLKIVAIVITRYFNHSFSGCSDNEG